MSSFWVRLGFLNRFLIDWPKPRISFGVPLDFLWMSFGFPLDFIRISFEFHKDLAISDSGNSAVLPEIRDSDCTILIKNVYGNDPPKQNS